jgi:hypothetical protein
VANKRKRRRPAGGGGRPTSSATSSKSDTARRTSATRAGAAKRRATELEAAERRRRVITRGVTLVVVAILAYFLLVRTTGPSQVSTAALSAGRAVGCGEIHHPLASAPGGEHLQPGESHTYDQHPATSGPHDPSPLPPDPHVYAAPIPETRAVHNLEHAYVLIYYRPAADGGLSDETVSALEALARDESRVIMAPYPALPEGTALAVAAWNTLWECPSSMTPAQATTIATGFIDAFRGTNIAPEPPRGVLGPLIQK